MRDIPKVGNSLSANADVKPTLAFLLAGDLPKQLQPARINLSLRNRIAQRTARLMRVAEICLMIRSGAYTSVKLTRS